MRDRVVTALAAAALWTGCQGKLFSISVDDAGQTLVEEGTVLETLLSDFGFSEFASMDITASSELENQGVAPGDIRDVRMVWMTLEALDGQGDLAFLSDLQIYVASPDLPRVLLASASTFPDGEAVVELVIEDVDLTDYATSQSMTFDTEVSGHRPSADTTVEVAFELDVGVTGQGACANL